MLETEEKSCVYGKAEVKLWIIICCSPHDSVNFKKNVEEAEMNAWNPSNLEEWDLADSSEVLDCSV